MPRAQLLELYAHSLGVVEDAHVEFGEGFNVLTGETGAGKTLLLGALQLCLGGEAPAARDRSDVRALALFLDPSGRELALGRETSSSGRLRSTLNAAPSSAEALRELGAGLVALHGQHDSLRLRNRSDVLSLLDESGAISTSELEEVRAGLSAARRERDALGGSDEERRRELDVIEFRLRELDGVAPRSPSELAEALGELERLSQLRDGQVALATVLESLDDGSTSALSLLARAIEQIPDGAAYDEARGALRDALVAAREAGSDLARLADPEIVDPARIAELESRVAALSELVRRYGSLASALDEGEAMRRRRDELIGAASRREEVLAQIEKWENDERLAAARLREGREAAASALESAVRRQLPRVALGAARVRFVVDGDDGSRVAILFGPGGTDSEGPLGEVASGGELSRVLLALALETTGDETVAVFDEIDAGLGGQVAQQIGQCLAELGERQQVLAVTHLASVAARARRHFVVEKGADAGRVSTRVREVTGEDRVREVARMLAGSAASEESHALARRLLDTNS